MTTARVCAEHGIELVDEPGGPYMPSIFGRTYCPECQRRFNAALDAQGKRVIERREMP